MNRLSIHAPLVMLAGIGWACAFAVVGFGIFARVPDNAPLAAVFGGFGFAAGAACTVLRLVFEQMLPMDLAASLRRPADHAEALEVRSTDVAPAATASAFGALS